MNNKSELYYKIKEILDTAPCGMGIFEIGTSKPLFLNKAYYDMIGYTEEEYAKIAAEQVSELILPQDISTSVETKNEFARRGEAVGYEYRIARKNGEIRWVKLECSTVQFDGIPCAFCSFFDITEEHDTVTKLNLIADSTNESISLFRISHNEKKLLFSNNRFYEMIGVSREQYAADCIRYDNTVVSETDRKRLIEAVESAVASGLPGELEHQVYSISGKTMWVQRRFVAMKQDDEDSNLLISIVADITEKKQQELLAELEQSRYELVVDELGAAVFEWNMETGAFYASQGYSKYAMSQVNPEDIFNNCGPADLVHPDDAEAIQRFFKETNEGKERVTVTLRLKLTSGDFHWCAMTGIYYRDSQGNSTRTIGVLVDVNEEHKKSFMLETLMNEMPGGVAIMHAEPELKCTFFSEGFAKLSGRTREEVQTLIDEGMLLEDTVAPSDYERFVLALKKGFQNGDDINITYRFVKKDGQIGWIHLTANMFGQDKKSPIYYCVFTQPTEESLLYRSLVKDSSTGVYVGERKTRRILYANDSFVKICGGTYHPEETECVLEDIIAEGRHPILSQEDIENLSYDQYSEFHVERPQFYFVVQAKALLWNGVDAYVVYITDDTNEHRQWLALQHQAEKEEAAQKVIRDTQAKSEFLSRMSHDMRTPMNGILGMVTLSEDETDSTKLKENLEKIKESGEYLLSLINDTLDIQRIESGKMKLEPTIVSTTEVVRNIIEMIGVTAKDKGVTLKYDKGNVDLNWYIRADALRLKQIFINLLSNAVKFTPAGGTVELEFKLLAREGMISHDVMYVRDTGVGMSNEFLENGIFKPFSQENNEVSANYAGSGLGLSIVKSLVELMGGHIEVESELGVGTTFAVYLDFERVDEEEAKTVIQDNKKQTQNVFDKLKGKQILLAEDHPLNAEIAKKLLEKAGCEVTWAKNGHETVSVFYKAPVNAFDAILMDIRMPVMDGLEATRQIRGLDRLDAKKISIIAMTANAYEEDVKESIDAGMNAHLGKPIEINELYETLATYLTKE